MNREQKEKLKSAININQKFDLKTSNQSNIYKGRKYKDFNKIKDNIPKDLLDGKMTIKSKDFNNYMNVLNLMKDGFDFANLSNVKVSAELRPIFYDEKEEEENPDEYITLI